MPFFCRKPDKNNKGEKANPKKLCWKSKNNKKAREKLGIEAYTRHSPLLEKCCLLLSANESYQNAEEDMLLLTGLKIGHSTHHRKVQKIENMLPDIKQKLSEIAIDGGTIRLRGEKGKKVNGKSIK